MTNQDPCDRTPSRQITRDLVRSQHAYSVLIRAKNSAATLEETVARLRRQDAPPAEIIVVDSGSTDATLAIATKTGCRVIHYPAGESFNYSKALNIGFSAAASPFVLVISSHVWLNAADTTDWLLYLLHTLPLAAVYCPCGAAEATMSDCRAPRFFTIDSKNFSGLNGLSNCCAMYRRTDWEQRRFDENLATAEDQKWASQAYAEGGMTLCLRSHTAGYLNPHAGIHKDIREISYVSLYVLPQDEQHKRWRHHSGAMARNVLRRQWREAFVQLAVAKNCFVHSVLRKPFTASVKPR